MQYPTPSLRVDNHSLRSWVRGPGMIEAEEYRDRRRLLRRIRNPSYMERRVSGGNLAEAEAMDLARGRFGQRLYFAASTATARRKSESPLYPLRFAVASRRARSSAVKRTLTCCVRVPARAGAGGFWPSSSR